MKKLTFKRPVSNSVNSGFYLFIPLILCTGLALGAIKYDGEEEKENISLRELAVE